MWGNRKTGLINTLEMSPYVSTVEPLLTDTSLIRTVHLVPGKCPYILCKNNLYNTDNGHEISAPQLLNLFITDTPMMTVLIQHNFLSVVTCQSVINFLIVHTITVKNWFMLSVRISSYGCTREVWRARKKRKSCSRR